MFLPTPSRPMKSILLLLFLTLALRLTAASNTTLYQTSFEAPAFTPGSPLRGQDNWDMYQDGEAISVGTNNARTGTQCLRIDGAQLEQTGPNSASAFGFSTVLLNDPSPTPPPIVELTAYVRLDGPQTGTDGNATNDLMSANFAAVADLGVSAPPRPVATFLVSSAGRIFTSGSLSQDRYKYSAPMSFGTYNKLVLRVDFLARKVTYTANDVELGSVLIDPEIRSERLAGGYLVMNGPIESMDAPYHYNRTDYTAYFDDYAIASVPLSPVNAVVGFASTNLLADESQQTVRLDLNRRGFLSAPLRLRVTTSNETALSGRDYEQVSTLITFAAGQTNTAVEVPIPDDFFPEPDTTFSVYISELPLGVTSAAPVAKVIIRDDERPGSIDDSWQSDLGLPPLGKDQSMFSSLIVQPDGKILVAVIRNSPTFTRIDQRVVRINPDGKPDPGFRSIVVNLGNGLNFFLMPDGRIVVAEDPVNNGLGSVKRLRRYHSDGTPDNSFKASVECPTPGPWVVGLPSGKMLLMGSRRYTGAANRVNGVEVANLVRLNSDGSQDSTFKAPSGLEFYTWQSRIPLKLLSSGQILVGTESTRPVYRLNEDGSIDQSFTITKATVSLDVNPYPIITDIMVYPDGRILAGGLFDTFNGKKQASIARLNADGSVDETFQAGLGFEGGVIETLDALSNGHVLVGANAGTYNGQKGNGPFLLSANGTMDFAFAPTLVPNPFPQFSDPVAVSVLAVHEGYPLFSSRFGLGRLRMDIPLRIVSHTHEAKGTSHLLANALPDRSYTLQSSENLRDWTDLSTQVATTNRIEFSDAPAPSLPRRLYRVKQN